MSRKIRGKHPLLIEDLLIDGFAAEGKAIAHYEGKVVFVQYAAVGDILDVEVFRSKSKYMEARILRIKKPSEERVSAFCEHFQMCGGCKLQHIEYQSQLKYKARQVAEQLKHIGGVELEVSDPLDHIQASKNQTHYRNKIEYSFSSKRYLLPEEMRSGREFSQEERLALGYHIPSCFDKILDIKNCYLQTEPSNSIRLFVKEKASELGIEFNNIREKEGILRNLIIRNNSRGEFMLIFSIRTIDLDKIKPLFDAVLTQFPEVVSLQYCFNDKVNDSIADLDIKVYKGTDHLMQYMRRYEAGAAAATSSSVEVAHGSEAAISLSVADAAATEVCGTNSDNTAAAKTDAAAAATEACGTNSDNTAAAKTDAAAAANLGSDQTEYLSFKIGPKSFYQTNDLQAEALYRIVADYAGITKDDLVYDLYTGTGTIAIYVAALAKKVIGVEYVEDAVRDARINASINGIDNAEFYSGDAAKLFTDNWIKEKGVPDIIITDPPRDGMHPSVLAQIIKILPKRIVYVSCNPATQARDVSVLKQFYSVKAFRAVDMFPHTAHVENVLLLERNSK